MDNDEKIVENSSKNNGDTINSEINNKEIQNIKENADVKNNKKEKQKKKINKRLIILIIIIIVIIAITAALIILKVLSLKKEYEKAKKENNTEVFVSENKKEDPDKKFLVNKKGDTYDLNDIEYKYVYDNDGVISNEYTSDYKKSLFRYVQISGLKDTEVQDKINKGIKAAVYGCYEIKSNYKYHIMASIKSNFSNILSIEIYGSEDNSNNPENIYRKIKGLNYDLNTGEQIPFEKIFISSTPIATLISNAAYKTLAWNVDLPIDNEEVYNVNHDMNKRDTSDYEETLLSIVNKYNNLKDNLNYSITPSGVDIYDIIPGERGTISIKFGDCRDYIAIFKRYLNSESLYNSTIGIKNILSFTIPLANNALNDIYDFSSENLYIDAYFGNDINDSTSNKVLNDSKSRLNVILNKLKDEAKTNTSNGYAYQSYASINENKEEGYISANLFYSKVIMARKYFDENLQNILIKIQNSPKVSLDDVFIGVYQNQFELSLNEIGDINWYYDLSGNYLGDSLDSIKKKQPNKPTDIVQNNNNINIYQ